MTKVCGKSGTIKASMFDALPEYAKVTVEFNSGMESIVDVFAGFAHGHHPRPRREIHVPTAWVLL